MQLQDIWLYFENGIFLQAKSFGVAGECVGEVVFNTSLSGYQEIISDPSYAGQFIVFCMPEIGIVGCNQQDMESPQAFAKGVLIRNLNKMKSNFRAEETITTFFQKQNLIGICHVDTRGIVKMLRNHGTLHMIASTQTKNQEELAQKLHGAKKIHEINLIQEVSTKKPYLHTRGIFNFQNFDYETINLHDVKRKKIIAIDYGIKRNILNELSNVGLSVEVVPQSFDAYDLVHRYKSKEIGGIFLSNGPGDPVFLQEQIEKIRIFIAEKIPLFGICLGHQLLSNAYGYTTYKLKFGQHGGNHPVKNLQTGILEITAQNHNYNVPESICEVATITHRNLFDNTIEGVWYKDSQIFSVQHHPESSPGPKESNKIFAEFAKIVTQTIPCKV